MSTDDAGRVAEQAIDIWYLPKIRSVRAEQARFDPPRLHVRDGRVFPVESADTVVVETDGDFPSRAAGPVLYVGEVGLAESELIGARRYRFLALNGEELSEGAPIGLGWSGIAGPQVKTRFKYRSKGRAQNS